MRHYQKWLITKFENLKKSVDNIKTSEYIRLHKSKGACEFLTGATFYPPDIPVSFPEHVVSKEEQQSR